MSAAGSRSTDTRRSAWRWHFWAGLIVAPVLLVVSITGGVLVFEQEISLAFDAVWHTADPVVGAPERISLDELRPIAEAATRTGQRLSDVYVFGDPSLTTIFVFRDGGFDRRTAERVAVHPFTGDVVGSRTDESATERVLRWMVVLHESLFAGTVGKLIVELVTAWSVVLVVTGIMLWWPRSWKILRGVWTVRTKGSRNIVWRDWHTVVAAYLAIPTMLILVSGMYLSFGTGGAWSLVTLATGGIPETVLAPPTVERTTEAPSLLQPALDRASEVRPGSPIYDLSLPYSDNDTIRVVAGSAGPPIGGAYVYVDPQTGELVTSVSQADIALHGQPLTLAYGVHVGAIGGMPTKLPALAVCVVLIFSTLTGVYMWLIRKPDGRMGAPKPRRGPAARWYVVAGAFACVTMPTFGVSVLMILAGRRVRRLFDTRKHVSTR